MRRNKPPPAEPPPAADQGEAPRSVVVLHPRAVLTVEQATAVFGLTPNCLPREIRLGRLRASRRAGRYWVLGAWLLQWLQAGEVRRERRPVIHGSNGTSSTGP